MARLAHSLRKSIDKYLPKDIQIDALKMLKEDNQDANGKGQAARRAVAA